MKKKMTIDKLILSLDELFELVYQLQINRFIFKTIWHLIQVNPELQKRQSHIYLWLINNHIETMIIGIRRLCDRRKGTKSLIKFLEHIRDNSSLISRQNYINLHDLKSVKCFGNLSNNRNKIFKIQVANSEYDKLFGKGILKPSQKDIQKEIDELILITKTIKNYADERIAHHSEKPPASFPTFDDIDTAINHIINLLKKYFHILKATAMEFDIHFQYNYLAPLEVTWLPDYALLKDLKYKF